MILSTRGFNEVHDSDRLYDFQFVAHTTELLCLLIIALVSVGWFHGDLPIPIIIFQNAGVWTQGGQTVHTAVTGRPVASSRAREFP
ncbi:hypothetical protein RRG08_061133 [Elysia crispata]|uniref:Uncharacterized protein n=1 Tax=Elysia crispata TaxID=231223 RepID=A0AAE0XDH2_9GAST|nr:hypothetical protein RRG08_061133 [Elysia crispata]